MSLLQALILSFVEGITEFLPISSTGHLVLISRLLNVTQTDFVKSFEVFIQLGAILAIVWLYWKDLLDTRLWPKLLAAFVPTAILGFIFYNFIKEYLLGNIEVTLAALFVGGLVLMFIHKIPTGSNRSLTIKIAVMIGLFQSLSMIPGVSRAAATIIGALLLGINKDEAVKFSFLLAVPTMTAASGLDLIKSNFSHISSEWLVLATGLIGAFITALVVVKFFLKYIRANNFQIFGLYRIIFAIAYLLAFFQL